MEQSQSSKIEFPIEVGLPNEEVATDILCGESRVLVSTLKNNVYG